jgi:hypothetical protein
MERDLQAAVEAALKARDAKRSKSAVLTVATLFFGFIAIWVLVNVMNSCDPEGDEIARRRAQTATQQNP